MVADPKAFGVSLSRSKGGGACFVLPRCVGSGNFPGPLIKPGGALGLPPRSRKLRMGPETLFPTRGGVWPTTLSAGSIPEESLIVRRLGLVFRPMSVYTTSVWKPHAGRRLMEEGQGSRIFLIISDPVHLNWAGGPGYDGLVVLTSTRAGSSVAARMANRSGSGRKKQDCQRPPKTATALISTTGGQTFSSTRYHYVQSIRAATPMGSAISEILSSRGWDRISISAL